MASKLRVRVNSHLIDGNVSGAVGIVYKQLKNHGFKTEAKEFKREASPCMQGDIGAVAEIIHNYVEVC